MAPVFRILLDQSDDHVYMPGDPVSGKIAFETAKSYDVKEIAVTFQGKSYAAFVESPYSICWEDRTYSHDVQVQSIYLFRCEKSVVQGPYTLQSGYWEWPFEFSFPYKTMSYRELEQTPYSSAPHVLPPSMGANFIRNCANVTYKVKAKLEHPFLGQSDEKLLNLTNGRKEAQPDAVPIKLSQTFSHKSARLRPGYENQFGLKERIKHIGKSHRQPTVEFTASCSIPRNVVVGQTIPLPFTIDVDEEKSTPGHIPQFTLRGIKVLLLRHTHTLVEKDQDEVIDSFQVALDKTLSCPIGVGTEVDLNTFLPVCTPDHVSPSFESYALQSIYALRVAVTIHCGGKDFITMPEAKRVVVHGAKLEVGEEAASNDEIFDLPPSYSPDHISGAPPLGKMSMSTRKDIGTMKNLGPKRSRRDPRYNFQSGINCAPVI